MAHLKQYAYPEVGRNNAEKYHYSSAVRVGDTIQCAGQGGWDPKTFKFSSDLDAQIAQAFSNCELALKDAGGKGFEQVYRVNSYHCPLTTESMEITAKYFRQYMPKHKPIWTCVGVTKLGADEMLIEIEVNAHDPEGAAEA